MSSTAELDAVVDEIVDRVGQRLVVGLPLGLGKPNRLVNALYQRARAEPALDLEIVTALSLDPPRPRHWLEARLMEPILERLFGDDYPRLDYLADARAGRLPGNVRLTEFYFQSGAALGRPSLQRHYISANYTHVARDLVDRGVNVVLQLVARDADGRISLACNPDVTLDLMRRLDSAPAGRSRGEVFAVGQVHPALPFLPGDAVVEADFFDRIVEADPDQRLFALPRAPVSLQDHAVGFHASRLIADGGTLQIGIGAIGDSVAHALLLRHHGKADAINADCPFPVPEGHAGRFETGLHGVTEMLVGGLLKLFQEGVVKREVDGRAIYAGFFVETRDFYRTLRDMPQGQRDRIAMVPVSFTNALYGDEEKKRAARVNARFVNGAMKVSLLGDIMSDAIENGRVVSGVGGQFNFVEQALALEDGRSIITLAATRKSGGKLHSNIAWDIECTTVPRHLRDVVVTEYGIADIWGRSDAEVIAALIEIADSRFQDELIARAKKAGKLPQGYTLPESAKHNLPETVSAWLGPHGELLPTFPLGTDFNEIEQKLLPVLARLKQEASSVAGYLRLAMAAFTGKPHPDEKAALERMGFSANPTSLSGIALRGALRLSASERNWDAPDNDHG